jgi:alpha-tubulin suppressor-like RCC1 family protein
VPDNTAVSCFPPTLSSQVLVWGGAANANYTNIPETAMSGIVDVVAGSTVSFAITANGDAIGWGDNTNQQLTLPAATSGNIVSLSVSNSECMAILKDGSAIAWGNTLTGALEASPDITPGSVSAVAAGNKFGLVLLKDGRILHFGSTANDVASIPAAVQGNAIAISANDHTAAAVSRDGQVYVWGRNGRGETGPLPQEAIGKKFTAASCGKEFTVALTAGK